MSELEKSLGPKAYKTIEIAREQIFEPLTVKYLFISEDELRSHYVSSVAEGNFMYWSEIFYRCHMSAYGGLKRLLDWISIIEASDNNFISYCSGMRGLIECVGDTYHGLHAAAITLGDNKKMIKNIMEKTSSKITLNQELEDLLIHFTHASKPYSKLTGNKNHQPKKPWQYVAELEKGSGIKFYEYYEFLCELTHPAASSIGMNFDQQASGEMVFNPKKDRQLVIEARKADKDLIIELLMRGFNPITLLIKTINLFQLEGMYSKYSDSLVLDVPAWHRIIK